MERIITKDSMERFKERLHEEEKSTATVRKYMTDIRKLSAYLNGKAVTKENMILYKEYLIECGKFKISSINSFLAVANHFCEIMGWQDAKVREIKVQRETFRPEDKELTTDEFRRMVFAALEDGKERLAYIIQTIGGTGIRVSELQYITVQAVTSGTAKINCKGKVRQILLPAQLAKILKKYIKKNGIKSGPVFQTANGKPVDRSMVWREMKKLCEKADVDSSKIFPHNLRHLFARKFYELKKDIAKLADILGHSSIETTRIYIMSTQYEHRKQLNRMNMVVIST